MFGLDLQMTRKTMGKTMKLSFALAGTLALGSCSAVQPKAGCKTQATEYVVQYFKVSDNGMCMPDQEITAEILHLNHYAVDREKPGSLPKLAIEPADIAEGFDRAEHFMMEATGQQYSLGSFTTERAEDVVFKVPTDKDPVDQAVSVCSVPKLSDTGPVMIPATPADMAAMIEAHPAMERTYKWSKVQILTKPNSNAVHFGGRVERSDGACSITYDAAGIWPVRPCGDGKDAEGHADPHTGMPDDSLCNPLKRLHDIHDDEREMNSELKFKCDASTLYCVPERKFPSFATAKEQKAYQDSKDK
jgi:hypothetical protein